MATKFKEYIKSKGFRLDDDFVCLPYPVASAFLDCVTTACTESGLMVTYYFNVDTVKFFIDRAGVVRDSYKSPVTPPRIKLHEE